MGLPCAVANELIKLISIIGFRQVWNQLITTTRRRSSVVAPSPIFPFAAFFASPISEIGILLQFFEILFSAPAIRVKQMQSSDAYRSHPFIWSFFQLIHLESFPTLITTPC